MAENHLINQKYLKNLEKINNSTCLHPKCDREITTRGLCWTHYQTARRLVKKGLITYDELIKNKKILPTNY